MSVGQTKTSLMKMRSVGTIGWGEFLCERASLNSGGLEGE